MILLPFSKNAMPFLKPHTIRYSGKTDIPAYVSSLVFQLNLYFLSISCPNMLEVSNQYAIIYPIVNINRFL